MNVPTRKNSIAAGFGLAWLVFNAAGWGLGFGLQYMVMHSSGSEGITNLVSVLVAAGVIGLAQWLALRWLLPAIGAGSLGISWVILTMFGYSAGFLGGGILSNTLNDNSAPLLVSVVTFLSWALVGLTTSLLQWIELRLTARGGWWWIGSSTLGYGFGALLLSIVRLEQGAGPFAYALAGLVVGAATLMAISHLRRPARTAPDEVKPG
jgi:hypothetical protein